MIDRTFPNQRLSSPSTVARLWQDEQELTLWLRSNDGDLVAVPAMLIGQVRELVTKAEKEARRKI